MDIFLLVIFVGALIFWFSETPKITPSQLEKPNPPAPPVETEEQKNLRNALDLVTQKHQNLIAQEHQQQQKMQQAEQDKINWQKHHSLLDLAKIDSMTGVEFENYLAKLFTQLGFEVRKTATTGDYGADLILTRTAQVSPDLHGEKIAVQVKRSKNNVGVDAVQEALSGKLYYRCDTAWVVTNASRYTPNAKELAGCTAVRLFNRNQLQHLMKSES